MKVAVGTITAPTGAANQTTAVDVSSFGFSASEPLRAVKFFTSYRTATGAADGDIRWCNGFATNDGGTIQHAYHTAYSADTVTTEDTGRGINTTAALKGFSAGTTPTVEYVATCTTFTTTGFTLTWTTAPAAAIVVTYWAIGGSDTTARCGSHQMTATTTQNVTVNTGFGQPDLVFVSGHTAVALGDATGNTTFSLGAFNKALSSRHTLVGEADGSSGAMLMVHSQKSLAMEQWADNASPTMSTTTGTPSAVASWPTDGWQWTWSAVPGTLRQIIHLAIKTTAPVTIGSTTAPTGATLAQSLSHGANIPQTALFWGGLLPTNAASVTTATDLGGWFMGAYDGTNQAVQGTCQLDASTASSTGRWYDNTKAVQFYAPVAAGTNPPALKSQAAASVVGTGVTLTFSVADSLAREFNYVLVGAGTASPSPRPQSLQRVAAMRANLW